MVQVLRKSVDSMWRLLGSQTVRNQKSSQAIIERSRPLVSEYAELTDAEIVDRIKQISVLTTDNAQRSQWCALMHHALSRSLEMEPFDQQLQGALRLLVGDIAQMDTGEGKTLVGAIAAVGYVTSGHKVHIMGVNDYLAARDETLMGPLYDFLDISHGHIAESVLHSERAGVYARDIVYGAVHEYGFDVLRQGQITQPDDRLPIVHDVLIVDEADSVLVDEALMPLVLAGSTTSTSSIDPRLKDIIANLDESVDYTIDSLQGTVSLTDAGAQKIEDLLGGINLYDKEHVNSTLIHVNLLLNAYYLTHRDVHYMVRDGMVKLINSSRGRIAELQRWPDGLQEAVEIKEGLQQTDTGGVIDSITVQALVKKYDIICGMTGTALAAGEQFRQFYNLAISPIEPHKKRIREDQTTRIYDRKVHKVQAIVNYIAKVHESGQPILVGTHDVAESEELARLLEKRDLPVQVLNAKNDAKEAEIISQAGKKDAITVSTQMAGRGTDIKLGGAHATEEEFAEVAELGGLCVIGTGLHETARLDDQLRGRAGRQGDPGTSIFFASLEDPLITRYAPVHKIPSAIDDEGRLLKGKGEQDLAHAQRVSESLRLESHANTWKYNDIINKQRDVFVSRREEYLEGNQAWQRFLADEPDRAVELISHNIPMDTLEQAARDIVLYHLDKSWSEHLELANEILSGIHLRALGNQSPYDEYNSVIMQEFAQLGDEVWEQAREMFRTAPIDDDGVHLEEIDHRRSLYTWTYMTRDNPFTSSGAKLLTGIIGMFR